MKKRTEYLEKHPYSIYQGKDGKWYTTLPDATKDRGVKIIKRNTRVQVEDEVIAYWEENEDKPTIDEVFEEWNDRRLELKRVSAPTHLRDHQVYRRFYGEFGKQKISDLTVEDFVDFLEEQIPKYELTSKAFSGLKRVTKGILKQARRQRLVDFTAEDVFAEIDLSDCCFKKEIKEDCEEVFNEIEMDSILRYLERHPDRKNLGLILIFVSGLRVGELVALKKTDFVGNTVRVRRTETRIYRKDRGYSYEIKEFPKSQAGVRTVIIPKSFIWVIKDLCDTPEEYVFMEKGRRLTTNAIRRRLDYVCLGTGVRHKSPHKIRKTYGTILLDNNVDDRFIISQMGHTNIACTEMHYHRNRRSVEEKTEIVSNIVDFKRKSM